MTRASLAGYLLPRSPVILASCHTPRVRRLSPFARRLALVAAGGFVLRAVFALAIAPDSLNHRGDPRFFHLAANLLADGHGYIAPLPFIDSGSSIASTEHPPLWSAFLAVFSAVGARSYEAHELVACAVGAATVVCAGLLGRRLGGHRAGLLAAGGVAVYPVFVAMDGSLMSEPPYALAVAACLVLAFRMVERPSLPRGALLGLAIGLAVLVRGEAIGLLVFLLVPVLLQVPGGRGVGAAWSSARRWGGGGVGVWGGGRPGGFPQPRSRWVGRYSSRPRTAR